MIWKSSELSEISRIGDGAHASLKRIESGIPYLTAKNITKSGIDFGEMDYISEETYDKHFKEKASALTRPEKDDILYSIIGSIGGVYVMQDEKMGVSSSVAIIRAKSEMVLPRYLAYFLKSSAFDAQIQAIKGGVAQGFMSLGKLGTVSIMYPDDIDYQKKIVNILATYDELIENNQKQIKLLEEAAQRLYKEWFVDLRFPGYEDVDIVDGVPRGWNVYKIGERFVTVLGGTPSRTNASYWGGTIPWINSGEVNNCRIIKESEFISELGLNKSSTKLMPKHTTVLAITGATLGQVSYTEIEACANQSVVGIIDESQFHSIYLYLYMCDKIWHMIGKATGGAQQHINKDIVNEYPVVLPDVETVSKLNGFVEPLFNKISMLYKENIELTEARDRLLPKLMSGEIEV